MTAMGCWRFTKLPFDLNVAEVAEQGYRGRALGTTQARKGSELVPVIDESGGCLLPFSDCVRGFTRQRICGYAHACEHECACCGLLLARCASILIRGESQESSRMLSLTGQSA